MIKIENLSKTFSGKSVLDNINLEIKEGEILVVLGQSGTGKSVLLKHLIGLLKPDQGAIHINAKDITCLSEKELLKIRSNIGYLFQEGALYDFMNVAENIAFPLHEHTQFSKKIIAQKVTEILEIVDLKGIEKVYPSELSGGMRKRVALARAIILDSKILFCDEPTSGLDPIRSRDISDLIHDASRKLNCTTVITSHDIRNSFRIADRVVLMHGGKITAQGTESELRKSQDPFVKDFLMN